MQPKQAVSTLISELNGRIPPPVHTSGIEESRPVPAVLVENVEIENKNHHNSTYAGSKYDSSGTETEEIHRYYYDMRIQLLIRSDDEVGAYDILGTLQAELGKLSQRPYDLLHNDVSDLRIINSGPVTYQFNEPTETEISQSISLSTFYDTSDASLDTIQSLSKTYNVS